MATAYIDTQPAAELLNEAPRRITEKVQAGSLRAVKAPNQNGGGSGGMRYLIDVSSLPGKAQALYMLQSGADRGVPLVTGAEIVEYRERYGDEGMTEVIARMRACQQVRALRALKAPNLRDEIERVAEDYGVTARTLYRWVDAYAARGAAGLMRPIKRRDAGSTPSICAAAMRNAVILYCDKNKRKCSTIYEKLKAIAAELGEEACAKCPYNEGTQRRAKTAADVGLEDYPPCTDPDKRGMRLLDCRQTLSRILGGLPTDMVTLARKGEGAWKDEHMVMATRDKPGQTNAVWYGDHHQFDCFVLDSHGKAIRPWLTAWYDAATGALVGWALCEIPNTDTITEAFANAAAHTKHSEFYGLPAAIYIDNGRDYRSKVFEGGKISERDIGYLNANIATSSVIPLFNVAVHHAKPYQAWAKTVERFFGTLENIWIRDIPGWCGGRPSERPEDFGKDMQRLIERGELWTMDTLYVHLRDVVFPAYHSRAHEGHGGRSPMELYKSLPRARDDQPSAEMLAIAKLHMAERQITQSGIRFKNRLYWDDELIGRAGQMANIMYGSVDLESITVMVDGKYICEAMLKQSLQVLDEDEDKVAAHNAKQKTQLRDVKERLRRATRAVYSDEVDTARQGGNIMSLEYAKAAKGRKAKRAEAREDMDMVGTDAARRMFAALGSEMIRGAR